MTDFPSTTSVATTIPAGANMEVAGITEVVKFVSEVSVTVDEVVEEETNTIDGVCTVTGTYIIKGVEIKASWTITFED